MATIISGVHVNVDPPAKRWVIDGVLPYGSSALYGGTGTAKSFVALEMAGSVATGRKFVGTYPVRSGIVVYVSLEGDIEQRWHLWRKQSDLLVSEEE
jgi:RecA-family ATPase